MGDSTGQITQVQLLESGKKLQDFMNEAYRTLGNPLVLFNMEYEFICCAEGVFTDDRLWNEIVRNGVFSDQTIHFFLEECFIDAVANSKTITLLTSDNLKYDRLYGRVFNGYNNTVADLIAVACDKPFEPHDIDTFEDICGKLSQKIGRCESFKQYGILYHHRLICKILNDDINDKVIYSGHLSNLYEDLKTNLYVVAADAGGCNADKYRLEELRDLCKEMQPEYKYAAYSNYIVIIVSTEEDVLVVERDLHKLSRYFAENNIPTGISDRFENLFDLRKHYNQAVDSLAQTKL